MSVALGDRPRLHADASSLMAEQRQRNPWFELELLPTLRADVARIVCPK